MTFSEPTVRQCFQPFRLNAWLFHGQTFEDFIGTIRGAIIDDNDFHFDACLSDIERGDFEHAFEWLLDLRESWMEAMATLKKDRDRAASLN